MLPIAYVIDPLSKSPINDRLLSELRSFVGFTSNCDEAQLLLSELGESNVLQQLDFCKRATYVQPDTPAIIFAQNDIYTYFSKRINCLPLKGKLLNDFNAELFSQAFAEILAGKEFVDPRIQVVETTSSDCVPKTTIQKLSVKVNGQLNVGDTKRKLDRAWFAALAESDKPVVITFVIGHDGKAVDTNVLKSSGESVVDEAAIKAVNRCVFTELTAGTLVEAEFLNFTR